MNPPDLLDSAQISLNSIVILGTAGLIDTADAFEFAARLSECIEG